MDAPTNATEFNAQLENVIYLFRGIDTTAVVLRPDIDASQYEELELPDFNANLTLVATPAIFSIRSDENARFFLDI